MRAKLTTLIIGIVLGVAAALLYPGFHNQAPAPAPGGSEAGPVAAKQLWTCSMHPQIIQDHPGNCPICGMKLVPLRQQPTGGGAASGSTQLISIDPVTTQNMGIRTGTVTKGPLQRDIRLVGAVDYDEATLTEVTTKFKGWIEKLNVNVTGQQVHRGDALFEIYSPELYSAQAEYLLTRKQQGGHATEADFVKSSALTKLRYFDISADQIAELEKSGRPKKTLVIRAPHDGIVVEKTVLEGQMAEAGMKLFRIADLSTIWVLAQVYEQDVPYLRLGQEARVTLSYQPDSTYHGRVTYIYPTVDEETRTVKVRMEFPNPGYALKPGMFTNVSLTARLEDETLLVPDAAVLRSGETDTVFVALEGGRFEPRRVVLGPRAEGGRYQVVSGLADGERIVVSGQFMLDSESQLREAIQKMTEPVTPVSTAQAAPLPETGGAVHQHGQAAPAGKDSATAPAAGQPEGKTWYVCPMPEDKDVRSDKPGKCPKCGMELVPEKKEAAPPLLQKTDPGKSSAAGQEKPAAKTWYVCPMPEDADVRSDKPGKCPKCGMELVPEDKLQQEHHH